LSGLTSALTLALTSTPTSVLISILYSHLCSALPSSSTLALPSALTSASYLGPNAPFCARANPLWPELAYTALLGLLTVAAKFVPLHRQAHTLTRTSKDIYTHTHTRTHESADVLRAGRGLIVSIYP
jgi:hypothetical protein